MFLSFLYLVLAGFFIIFRLFVSKCTYIYEKRMYEDYLKLGSPLYLNEIKTKSNYLRDSAGILITIDKLYLRGLANFKLAFTYQKLADLFILRVSYMY